VSDSTSQALLKRLAVLAVALVAGSANADAALAAVPESAVDPLLGDELESMEEVDRGRLLRLLAFHPSFHVRGRIASHFIERPEPLGDDVEAAIERLVRDQHPGVRWIAIAALGPLLLQQGGLDRLRIVGEWAVSQHRSQRLAVACALATVPTTIAETALQVLERDDDPAVRVAAKRSRKLRAASLS
jgi:HEAT repeat protein